MSGTFLRSEIIKKYENVSAGKNNKSFCEITWLCVSFSFAGEKLETDCVDVSAARVYMPVEGMEWSRKKGFGVYGKKSISRGQTEKMYPTGRNIC